MKKKFGIILTIMLFVTLCLALSACNAIPKHTHDDGDCTTEAICAVCNEVLTAAKVHASSGSWSIDDRQHWKVCTNNGCTKLAVEMTNHTPIKDDGNCTTTITCSECQVVTTTAKAHTPADWSNTDSQHWKTCTNVGCTIFVEEKTNHTPIADDGNCTTVITCSECQVVTTAAKKHAPADWSNTDSQHWKACTNVGCTIFVEEKTNHTPIADDGNCTTVITCSECQVVTTAAKKHAPADWNKDDSQHWKTCTNEGCTRLVVEKATHTMKNDSNACECGNIVDLSIFTITDGLLSSCIPGTYTSITIPNSVTDISDFAFGECSGLTSIDIPNSVTSIGEGAFAECSGLTSITIPSSVTSIGLGAFAECSGLTSIEIPSSVTSIGAGAFMECSELTSITLAEGNTTYHSAGNCIIETATKTLVLGYKNSVIPTDGSVTIIGMGAFAGSGLTSITIPEGVTSIDISAYARCTLLTSITIPESVTSIGEGAFAYCIGLKSIIIPENVTTIGTYTFAMCMELTNITIPKSVTDISDSAFDECRKLTSITYSGTTAEWQAITKGTGLSSTTGNYTVICTDGTLTKAQS